MCTLMSVFFSALFKKARHAINYCRITVYHPFLIVLIICTIKSGLYLRIHVNSIIGLKGRHLDEAVSLAATAKTSLYEPVVDFKPVTYLLPASDSFLEI